jgi:hypothetical protein
MEYLCIDAYKNIEDPENWENCPNCGLKPKVWSFDNGRSTACGCGESIYNHFSIHAESIMSIVERNNGSCEEYKFDALRKNWNEWCLTGKIIFKHAQFRTDGKW